ncbi:L-seryl-tRNA(Sec) kinase [Cryptotermes secundus]|nr:L-seryl-tRNA(Sec) kinase [Cryptotermes secundus]
MSETEICLVIFIGLPGSGKTTLCSALVEYLKTSCKISNDIVQHAIPICYDRMIPANVFRYQDDSSQWKEARRGIVSYVKNLVSYLKGLEQQNTVNSFEISVREELLKITQSEKRRRVYVILDDNMYYRSMRYEYYQLAKLYNLSFCQLFVHCSVSDALNYNLSRDPGMTVPGEIITRMAKRLEPPDRQNNPWETYSLTVPSETWTVTKIKEIVHFLNYVSEHPVVLPLDDFEVRQESKLICSTNVIHQVDVMLRKIIGDRMRGGKTSLQQVELQAQSKVLADKRRHILEGIRTGRILVPEDICEAVELGQSNTGQSLRDFLSSLLTIS